MRVLIDYRSALRSRTGVGEWVHELTRALAALARVGGDTIGVFTSSWKDRPPPDLSTELGGVTVVDARIPNRVLNLLWHRLEHPLVERLAGEWDVVHAAHPLLIPSRQAAQVITIHDLDFLRHPERTRAEIRRDYGPLAASHAARADAIITPTSYTAEDVARELHVTPGKITVCPSGAPEWGDDDSLPPDGLPADRFLLFLGTLEPRKNIGALLESYERLVLDTSPLRRVPPLVIAGAITPDARPWIDRARRAPLAGRVYFTDYVADSARRGLYARASVFILPSHHEGFGLTALEAMSLGVPVIAASRGSLPEVVGDAGLLVDPDDRVALTTAMRRLLDDRSLALTCREKGLERARRFTWRASAERLLEAYSRAIEAREKRTTGRSRPGAVANAHRG